jgi:hypothetical protein
VSTGAQIIDRVDRLYMVVFRAIGNLNLIYEFCYGLYNQYGSFIYLDLIVKNREISIKRYFK